MFTDRYGGLTNRPSLLRSDVVEYDATERFVIIAQPSIHPKVMTHEVSMKQIKHEPKPQMAARFEAEARQALAKRSSQGRFLDIAASKDRSWEPVGRLAG